MRTIAFVFSTPHHIMCARRGGGKSRPAPPLENPKKLWRPFLPLFIHMETFLLRFSHYGLLSHYVGAFLLLFIQWWGQFWPCLPPYENFCGRPCTTYLSTCVVWMESIGLCDLNDMASRPPLATRHIHCVLLVNSPNKLNILSWLLIYLCNK